MPLARNAQQSTSKQSQQFESSEYQPKLIGATTQKHSDDPVTLAFLVANSQGAEEIVTIYTNSQELFESMQEGQQWVNQQQRGVQSIRRTA